MTTQEIKDYYDVTEHSDVRSDLIYASEIITGPKVAIDCGCGSGSDIEYLSSHDFKVYGFDIEDESIKRCTERFNNNNNVILTKAGFSSYTYPKASLVVADASLFFCNITDFDDVWVSITDCLSPDGIFCGSFLGAEDTMSSPSYDGDAFWPEILVFKEAEVRGIFKGYEICRFTEHKKSGMTAQGSKHDWHIYSVVAKKTDIFL